VRRWWLVVALLLSLGINAGVVGVLLIQRLRDRGRPPLPGPGFGMGRAPLLALADELRLSGEQRERFLQIQRSFFEQTLRDRQQLDEVRRDLRLEVLRRNPDRVRVDELLRQMSTLTGQLERAFVGNVLATREILTEEQQRRFLELVPRLRQQPGLTGGGRPFRPLLHRLLRGGERPEPEPAGEAPPGRDPGPGPGEP
jgi:Spy/CpxP family protein refolding chaperone